MIAAFFYFGGHCADSDDCPFPVEAVALGVGVALAVFVILSVLAWMAERRGYRPAPRRPRRKFGPGWGYNRKYRNRRR